MVDYAVSRVERCALDIIMSHTNEDTEDLDIKTVVELLRIFKEWFGYPDPTGTARRELFQLC